MISIPSFQAAASSFEKVSVGPHFNLIAYRTPKRIFATLDISIRRACLMLPPVQQDSFCHFDPEAVCPVPNKWGQKGATWFYLNKVPKQMCLDALLLAYQSAIPATR